VIRLVTLARAVMQSVAVFRFSASEGPAQFGHWLDQQALPWRLVAVDRGDAIPTGATGFAGLGLMGGPMGVNDELPWIEPTCALLRDAVANGVPVIGHCLGGQLLARALGAVVARTPVPEQGWGEVARASDAVGDWFGGRDRFTVFQWHYDAFELPAGSVRALTNGCNPNQAFVVDDRHIGLQCHVEMTRALIESWCASGAAELPPVSEGARQSRADILGAIDTRLPALQQVADAIYRRWSAGLRR
jgi:GMP synthase-like glutamine amidotransferase